MRCDKCINKVLNYFGLMLIKDAELIAVAIENKSLNTFKEYIKVDAPNLHSAWLDSADEDNEKWTRVVFRDGIKMLRDGQALDE